MLAESICEAYDQHHCDGLLLPLVDHHGVAMPISDIVCALLERDCLPKQVVVDASQALGHIPIDFRLLGCDLLIGGTHKWMGSREPLGVGVSLRPLAVNGYRMSAIDPLLRLTQEQTGGCQSRHGETAAIAPLLSAAGAFSDCPPEEVRRRLATLRSNRRTLAALLQRAGWRVIRETEEHHGILLARTPWRETPGQQATLQNTFRQQGVSVTIYRSGLVRFSMPHQPFSECDLTVLDSVLRQTPLTSLGRRRCDKADKVPRYLKWNRTQTHVPVQPAVPT